MKSATRFISAALILVLTFSLLSEIAMTPSSASIPTDGLQLDLRANKGVSYSGTGTTWNDLSGAGRNATLVGGEFWDPLDGGQFLLDGVDDHFTVPTGFADFTSGLTISVTANFGSATSAIWERLIDFGNGEGQNNFFLSRNENTNTLHFNLFNGSVPAIGCEIGNGILNNSWATYSVTINGQVCKLFRNNDLLNGPGTTFTALPSNVTRTSNYIGRSNWARDTYLESGISAVAIWNRALSDAEIAQVVRIQTDATAPTFSSASVAPGGTSLTLTYNETLSATTAAKERFTVLRTRLGWVNAETPSVSSVAVSGSSITLSLGGTIFSGDAVTVSYSDPSGGDDVSAVQDSAGNDAASLTNQAVTNNSTVKRSQTALSINQSTLVYGETLTLTTSGGLGTGAVTYDENSAACSISGTTLTGVASGDCIVTATKATDDVFLETTTTKTITITQATQTITFTSLADKTLGMSAVTLSASASSGLAVSFSSSDASICSTSGSNGTTLTLLTSGTCTITASQSGNSNFTAASDVIRSFTIAPTLLLATPSSPSSNLTAPYGASYSLDLSLSLSGGSGGTTYAITTGSLPPGLTLNTATGLISGTPTSLGNSALVITATDSNGATSVTSSFTISVTQGSATATIAFSSTTLTFGVANPITVTVSTAGVVRFSANGRVIKTCKSISTITSGSITATCNYRPATRRPLTITARLTPTDLNIAARTSTSAQFLVGRRTGERG